MLPFTCYGCIFQLTAHIEKRKDKNEKHRLGKGAFIELAFGEPKEKDITRYEDDYGRV